MQLAVKYANMLKFVLRLSLCTMEMIYSYIMINESKSHCEKKNEFAKQTKEDSNRYSRVYSKILYDYTNNIFCDK